ncbi:protein FAM83G isoform X2 [Seriola lalandi dorsalis]|uniref:Family with sequence similarity 83 member G n=1 Tax=Seriola lalandi dorsalis TaxID=1841481 RepID=A0A3B4YNM8_SERLL|nr:protein FAM83G isoform X2 [Seriola lalandi dorsalis]
MALSQIQCLDDHHVNLRVSESKPEFFYSEDQRLALEALVTKGRDAFTDYTRKNGVREFLSEPELERIAHTAEAYRPGHEHHQKSETPGPGNITPGSAEEGGDGEVSLQYWPDRSEASVAELDLGWPDCISYRGVTRVTVYTQPPTEGHTHIKEVVRKSIASAQKVIAVVMDVFTDVDIFRDLLDAAFKRRVPVYIIIDMAAVPCFLSMCGRADMHRGHLKNVRVRCCGGVEFFTRSAQKVRGSLSQKFLLVDGDRAISGSYSFTWSSSRLDRNLITVITGQAVETFDLQFRDLYLSSRGVSLSKVPLVDEPIPDLIPHTAPAPVSAAVARKLINPKYALVATGTHTSPASSDQNSSNKNSNSQNPTGLKMMKGRLKGVIEEPPIHPGLAHLEKAYLIPYLPTWPEPDPPSDVIGFINIRDEKRANRVHLQRSERFEVSQAIRFSSPLALAAQTGGPASGQDANAAGKAKNPSGNTSTEVCTPVSPTKKQDKEKTHTTLNKGQTDATDSKEAPQQPKTPPAQDTHKNAHTPKSSTKVTADSQPKDSAKETPEAQTAAPPVPKRRTLHLVIDSAPSEQLNQPLVTLVKMDQLESLDGSSSKKRTGEGRGRITSKNDCRDSCSNEDGSQDSTKVMCDRAANDDPSSASTASEEEFYDSQQEPSDLLTNGVTTGSGHGHRQGDGVNMMARLSQSMLDLREPSQPEDSKDLIRQSQQLRRQGHPSPHRHIGQLFQTSRSPGRDTRMRGPKVVIAKPGSYHRPTRAAGPVIGGHRYWQGQMLQPDSAQLRTDTRSSRSPRRHSPGYRKMDHALPHPPDNSSGLLGVSFSKVNNFRHLRARGGMTQKKAFQNNKATR